MTMRAILLLIPLLGAVSVAPSCATDAQLEQIDEGISELDELILDLETRARTVGLTPNEVTLLDSMRRERAQLKEGRELVDPGTGPGIVLSWFVRAAAGDPMALTQGVGGAGALWALLQLKRRKRKRRPMVWASRTAVADGEVVEEEPDAGASVVPPEGPVL